MRNVSDKCCRENQDTQFVFSNVFTKNVVYEVLWKHFVERGRPQMTKWRMRFACCITKATDTRSECVILIDFPQQKWLHERSSMLRYTLTAFLVKVNLGAVPPSSSKFTFTAAGLM
jgi:hypothetical protein